MLILFKLFYMYTFTNISISVYHLLFYPSQDNASRVGLPEFELFSAKFPVDRLCPAVTVE